jgi:hypothetical protein
VTPDDFRCLALEMPEAVEASHMSHPDFRVGGKIFATLGYPRVDLGMVKLTPEQQREFVQANPEAFAPVPGGWGLRGATHVRLNKADEVTVQPAIAAAWGNIVPKTPIGRRKSRVRQSTARSGPR